MKRIILTLVLSFLSFGANAAPVQWSGNGHYYDLVIVQLSWAEADAEAKNLSWNGLGGHLATITSQEENDFIYSIMPNGAYTYWLGGTQTDLSGGMDEGWEWTTGEAWDYTNWNAGEPNDDLGRSQDSLVFQAFNAGYWDDGDNAENASTFGIHY